MKKIKILIIILLLLVLLLALFLFLIKNNNKDVNNEDFLYEGDEPQDKMEVDDELKEEEEISACYLVNNLIKQLIMFVNNNNYEAIESICTEFNNEVINQLAGSKFYMQELFVTRNLEYATYYAHGINNLGTKLEEIYYKVNLDYLNNTYNIELINEEIFNQAKNGKIEKVTKNVIDKNTYNQYKLVNVSMEERAGFYINDFLIKIKYDLENAYNLLDEDYKKSKFNSIEEFNDYVKNNNIINKLENIEITNVGYNYNNDYMEFRVETDDGSNYIIRESKILHYTIILDTYTINNKEYSNEYINYEPKMKVAYNIDKVIAMINNKDYSSIYKLLDKGFKNKFFPDEETFKEYAKNKFFETNYLDDLTILQSEGIFTCTCELKSGIALASNKKTIVFYMCLGEGMDYTLSINMQ